MIFETVEEAAMLTPCLDIEVQWNLDLRARKIRANPDLRAIFVLTTFLLSKFTLN